MAVIVKVDVMGLTPFCVFVIVRPTAIVIHLGAAEFGDRRVHCLVIVPTIPAAVGAFRREHIRHGGITQTVTIVIATLVHRP